jgi:hypothetical protein
VRHDSAGSRASSPAGAHGATRQRGQYVEVSGAGAHRDTTARSRRRAAQERTARHDSARAEARRRSARPGTNNEQRGRHAGTCSATQRRSRSAQTWRTWRTARHDIAEARRRSARLGTNNGQRQSTRGRHAGTCSATQRRSRSAQTWRTPRETVTARPDRRDQHADACAQTGADNAVQHNTAGACARRTVGAQRARLLCFLFCLAMVWFRRDESPELLNPSGGLW